MSASENNVGPAKPAEPAPDPSEISLRLGGHRNFPVPPGAGEYRWTKSRGWTRKEFQAQSQEPTP